MALEAAQILRHAFASGADAVRDASDVAAQQKVAAPERGVAMGTSFVVESNPMSELMDSMEELSFQFEEKESKRVGERKLGEMQGPRTALVKAIEKYLAMMPDMPGKEFVNGMARSLRFMAASGSLPDPRELLKELARGSTDPSHQFAMLDILEQAFGEGEEGIRDLVRQTKASLLEAKGPEVKAGLNLANEVNARATSPDEMQSLRDMYRGEVVGFTKVQDCFRSLVATRGAAGLSDALSFLMAGCAADLASSSPSIDPAALSRILTDLSCVQVLKTVMERLSALSGRMEVQFGEKCLLGGEQLAGRVLDLTEQSFVAAGSMASLVGDCGLVKLLSKMDFMREMNRIFRQLSPRLFAKESDRLSLVDASQEYLDELVAEEEEEEGAA